MQRYRDWPAAFVAIFFILLVGFIFYMTMDRMDNSDEFLKIWAAVGPIVGVVTGLIPTYFFHNAARESSYRADKNSEEMGEYKGEMNKYKGMLMGNEISLETGLPVSNKSQETGETPKPS